MNTFKFKVNGLNKKNNEGWKYTNNISYAMNVRSHAQNDGINSNIYEKVSGKCVCTLFKCPITHECLTQVGSKPINKFEK